MDTAFNPVRDRNNKPCDLCFDLVVVAVVRGGGGCGGGSGGGGHFAVAIFVCT